MTKELTTKFINLLKGETQTTAIAIEIKRLEETIRLAEQVDYSLLEKMKYLEKKFNAPMDIIIKAINYCKKNNLCITEISLTK
tara:strand:+ start:1514 stop:1762 length:249 start_codon:yes stop_codon:yes gene_type:complete